ncbi:kelch-like protein 7 [Styela clava]|uniref:kelch-like protein 12 n=1 Tax=Styela clava TaxID=7725 RepID=UPI001939D405|nr:kelch-like protein 12 [Styela clava]
MEVVIADSEYQSSSLERINNLREYGLYCDFVIVVEEEKLPVHKNVIAANSDYFRAMLSHDTKESMEGTVEIQDVQIKAVRICIAYIYTGIASFENDDILEVYHTADVFQLHRLVTNILKHLTEQMSRENVFISKQLARKYDFKDLDEKCDKYAIDHFVAIMKTTAFLQLESEYLIYLVSSQKNKDTREEQVCDAIIKWVEYDIKPRKELFPELLQLVDLNLMGLPYRRHLVENEVLINSSSESLTKTALSVFKSHLKVSSLSCDQTVAPSYQNKVVVLDGSPEFIREYDGHRKVWEETEIVSSDAISGCDNYSAVYVDPYIFILSDDKSVYRLKYTKDPNAMWIKVSSMLKDHGARPPAIAHDGAIYVIGLGNESPGKTTASGEKYSVPEDRWTPLPDMSEEKDMNALAAVGHSIYSCGGLLRKTPLNTVEKLNLKTMHWQGVASMKTPRYGAAAVTYNDKIYVIGGENTTVLSYAEFYDTITGVWTDILQMTMPRNYCHGFVHDNKIYAVSGIWGTNFFGEPVEAYDIEKNTWERQTRFLAPVREITWVLSM